MHRRTFVVMAVGIGVVGLVLLVGSVAGNYLMRPAPKPAMAVANLQPAAQPAIAPTPPAPETPPDARAPVKRGPAPKVEAPPAPPPVEAPPTVATLHIDSDVPGAQVFIDRVFIGGTPVTAKDVRPGPHRLNVSAPGYDGYGDTIDVVAGSRDVVINLKDVKLDAKIDVVHKHALGSCKGTLVATPQELRYETTNKNDGFSTALTDIGSFEVDYLEKNLKVKLKNGKQYNFTDAEGNADRLYLFHGEVDKVRQRLKKGGRP